jgi:hypothetical protein
MEISTPDLGVGRELFHLIKHNFSNVHWTLCGAANALESVNINIYILYSNVLST